MNRLGTQERRQRDREARELLFVQTARELIQEEGLLKLQMARLAEKCEYAVGTLYQHFASKEDLLLELVRQDISAHVALYQRVAHWRASARDRILGMVVADTLFIRSNPGHFRLGQYAFCEVVWQAASPDRRQALIDEQVPISDIAIGLVQEAIASGHLPEQGLSAPEIAVSLWALPLGVHVMKHAEGMLQSLAVGDGDRLMCRQLQALLNGLEWQPRVDLADGAALDALIERIRNEVFDDFNFKA